MQRSMSRDRVRGIWAVFGADIAGPLTDYANVAERIWGTWLDCSRRA